jgi:hypothetical protein
LLAASAFLVLAQEGGAWGDRSAVRLPSLSGAYGRHPSVPSLALSLPASSGLRRGGCMAAGQQGMFRDKPASSIDLETLSVCLSVDLPNRFPALFCLLACCVQYDLPVSRALPVTPCPPHCISS